MNIKYYFNKFKTELIALTLMVGIGAATPFSIDKIMNQSIQVNESTIEEILYKTEYPSLTTRDKNGDGIEEYFLGFIDKEGNYKGIEVDKSYLK